MKIFYIVNARIPTEKAHGYQISKVCEEWGKQGIKVEVWLPLRRNKISQDVFSFYGILKIFTVRYFGFFDALAWFPNRFGFLLQQVFFMIAVGWRTLPQDAVVFTRNAELALLFRLRGKRVVYNAHNFRGRSASFLKIFVGVSTPVVANSKGTAKAFMEAGFTTVLAVPNGVDVKQFQNLPSCQEARARLGLPLDKKIAMYVGHLYEWKGSALLLDLARHLEKNPEIILVIIGGTEEDVGRIQEEVGRKAIHNILFMGFRPKESIPLFLRSADVLLLPNTSKSIESTLYTSPIKMFEYMASGTPIVAADLPSLREVLHEKNSRLVSPDSAEAFLSGIQDVVRGGGEARAVEAKRDVDMYSWEKHAGRVLEFLSSSYTTLAS